MKVDLEDKVALVTGAGQGIGAAIAKSLAESGAMVSVVTRTASNGEQTVNDIQAAGGRASLIQADVGQSAQVAQSVESTVANYGRLDIAVHNAANYPIMAIEEISDKDLDYTLAVNLQAAFWLTRASVPHFRNAKGGRILITSSVTGNSVAMPEVAHYAASKGGLSGFIRAAALEYARENITVNAVEPGFILTKAMTALGTDEEIAEMARYVPEGKIGKPEDIANAMLFLASEEAYYITGQTITVDGGSTLPESPVILESYYKERGL
jgi:3-oxoacyl-[acyl-carrier protein] reductase